MRKLATCLLLLTPLFLGGCLEPTTPQAVIDSEPKASQGVIWLQDYPAVVYFDASKSTGEILSYQWTVLDEGGEEVATGNEEQFSHEFGYGRYVVRLKIITFAHETDEAQVEVIANKPPVAKFSYTLIGANRVQFNASDSYDPDGKIASYHWSFDDGSIDFSDEPVVEHRYRVAGKYEVRLVVVDDYGDPCESPAVRTITVGCPSCGSS